MSGYLNERDGEFILSPEQQKRLSNGGVIPPGHQPLVGSTPDCVVHLSDEDRDLLRQIRDRLPAPATENDYQAVTIQGSDGSLHRYPIRLTEDQESSPPVPEGVTPLPSSIRTVNKESGYPLDDRDYTHP